MSAITPFNFEHTAVRTIARDGQPWFIAADVCAALGLGNPSMAVAKLDADEKGVSSIDTLGGAQTVIVVNESGLYATILRCRDAMTAGSPAHRFRRWVTSEVLPAIRRTGTYAVQSPSEGGPTAAALLNDAAGLRALLLGYSEQVLQLEHRAGELAGENAVLAPKAAALDRIAVAEGSMNITAAAKAIGVGPRGLGDWLRDHKWTYRREQGGSAFAFQAKIDAGLLEQRMVTVDQHGRPARAYWQVFVTARGVAKLAELIGQRRAA